MNPLPDSILTQLQDHEDRLNNMERSARSTIINDSPTDMYLDFSLAAAGSAGDMLFLVTRLKNANGAKALGEPKLDLLRNNSSPWSDNNAYPGSNFSNAELRGLDIMSYFLRTPPTWIVTDPADSHHQITIRNRSGSAINNMRLYINWRFPMLQGDTL